MFHGKIRPEKLTLEFLRSKEAEEERKNTREWELLQNPTINLERAKREFIYVEENLADRRMVLREQRKDLDGQWKDLELKELALQQNFSLFNKFIKENQGKSLRAKEKLKQSLEFYEETKQKTDEIKKKFSAQSEAKDKMDRAIRKHNIYENFLHQLKGPSNGFKTVDDILNRYESYVEAARELMMKQEDGMEQLQNARANMIKNVVHYENLLVGMHTKAAGSRSRFEDANIKSRKWESIVNHIKTAIQEQFNLSQNVKLAIWEVYKDFCRKKNAPVILKENMVEEQLLYIKKAILNLKKVRNRVAKTLNAKEKKT